MRISDWSSTCALPIYIMTELAISIRLDMPFAETVDATREALSEQGFGIVTEIDMQSTLKAKIDAEIERYVIRTEENTSEIQSLMRNSYAVFCWTKKEKKEAKIHY